MLRVGLTGGIASGKSVIRRVFERLGIPMLDADETVHAYLAPGGALVSAIVARFGGEVLAEDGGVDRKALGARVFLDEEARRWLHAETHPRIRRDIAAFLDEREAEGNPVAGVEAALLIETGSYRNYDRVVLAACPPRDQLERLLARTPGMTPDEGRLRLAAQLPLEEKVSRATDVLDTSGTLGNTEARAEELARLLQEDTGRTGGD